MVLRAGSLYIATLNGVNRDVLVITHKSGWSLREASFATKQSPLWRRLLREQRSQSWHCLPGQV